MEKKSEEILAELYRNGVLAMQSIEDILPAADEATKAELEREYGEYENSFRAPPPSPARRASSSKNPAPSRRR